MKAKKLLSILSLAAVAGLTACGPKAPVETEHEGKLGLGYSARWYDSYGTKEADVTAAAVVLDAEGKIVSCYIDVVQVKAVLTSSGEGESQVWGIALKDGVAKNEIGYVKTKLELGLDYNMKGVSAIGQEVDAQINAYAEWTVGKTVAEVKAATGADSKTTDATLAASCSINVAEFSEAVAAAAAATKTVKYTDAVKVGLAINGGMAYNYGKPSVEIAVDLAAVAVEEGKVTCANIDAVVVHPAIAVEPSAEGDVHVLTASVDASSKYHTDGKVISKKILGDVYAMAERNGGQAGCTMEWDEQAALMEAAAEGLTSAEVAALDNAAMGSTITSASYVKAMAKAAANAR